MTLLAVLEGDKEAVKSLGTGKVSAAHLLNGPKVAGQQQDGCSVLSERRQKGSRTLASTILGFAVQRRAEAGLVVSCAFMLAQYCGAAYKARWTPGPPETHNLQSCHFCCTHSTASDPLL